MDNGNPSDNAYGDVYDNGGKRRTIIIASVVGVAVLVGIAVIVLLVIRARTGAGSPTKAGASATQAPLNIPPAKVMYVTTPNPEKVVSGTAVIPPPTSQAAAAPQPAVDRLLTADEKKRYGFPSTWTVRIHTVQGTFGPQLETEVVDQGSSGAPIPSPQ